MSLSQCEQQRLSICLAIALHLVLLAALLVHFATKATVLLNTPAATQIINASVVSQSVARHNSPNVAAKPVVEPVKIPPVKPEPVKQEPIKQEPVKQETVKSEPVKQPVLQHEVAKPLPTAQELAIKQAALKKQAQQKVAEQMHKELVAEEKKAKLQQKLAAKKAAEQSAKQLLQQELTANTAESNNETKDTKSIALSAQAQGEIDRYKTLIIQAISQQWIVPDNVAKGLEAKLLVTLAPGGMVVDVKITQSSGDPLLDRSAQTAVYKASPLPVPADSSLFNKFRTINLIVRPEGILSSN